jgi:3-deoxy-D-manno-octulosonic-acid transferase
MRISSLLRVYLILSHLFPLIAPIVLRRRLARGKEDPDRWREKRGEPTQRRPNGIMIWMHAVGLGEVLALRGLIASMSDARPDLRFLVTTTARSAAEVFAMNMPPRTVHQFLPIDAPRWRRSFLNHWKPDLTVWSDQEIWPGLVVDCATRGIPQVYVNARMDSAALRHRLWARDAFRDLFASFAWIAAQDRASATHLARFGAGSIQVTGSLKPSAPALADNPNERARLENLLHDRRVWLAASTHAEDEEVALNAQLLLRDKDPTALLILVPRLPDRGPEIADLCAAKGLTCTRRAAGQDPWPDVAVWIADTFGEVGLWYRLARVALIGGTFGPVQGHNPWEAVRLGCAVLHGPKIANFDGDYASLHLADAARRVSGPVELAAAIDALDLIAMAKRAATVVEDSQATATRLAERLIAILDRADG